MEDNQESRRLYTMAPGANVPVPAARPLDELGWEQVGDEIVILDVDTLQYHTLNSTATVIWLACDGKATPNQISAELNIPVELVEVTVAELGEADLLQSPGPQWDSAINRRRASKLIAAGLIGAVGLPIIKSITVPDAASAASIGQCAFGLTFPAFACGVCGIFGCSCQPVTSGGSGSCCVCGAGLQAASSGLSREEFVAKLNEYLATNGKPVTNQVDYIEVNVNDDEEPVQDEAVIESTDGGESAPEQVEGTTTEEAVETHPEVVEEQTVPVVQEEAAAETVDEAPADTEESVDTAAGDAEPTEEANG